MPISAMTFIAIGFITEGFIPALNTSNLLLFRCRKIPSAIWERQEFSMQRNNTFFFIFYHSMFLMVDIFSAHFPCDALPWFWVFQIQLCMNSICNFLWI